jgi:unsaturated rhamnogalacturonyl hydrolase
LRNVAAPVICVLISPAASLTAGERKPDWSVAVVESTLKRYPTLNLPQGWGYQRGLVLYGVYLVYLRTHDKRYLDYVKSWVDVYVDDTGTINRPIDAMVYVLPANLLLILYKETKQEKYKIAAESVRKVFATWPRTKDNGLWYNQQRPSQLWADGVFMSLPFLMRYGEMFGDRRYADDEAPGQMLIYYEHLNDPATGLLWHAYDESGVQPWADPVTHQSAVHWGRAIGWYAMSLIDVLDDLPRNHPRRGELIKIVQQLATAFEKYQDPKTGLWFQVVDKGALDGNWLETSASCMYTYMIWMGTKRGYLPKRYAVVAQQGYRGVLTKLSIDESGLTNLVDISASATVGDLAFYVGRDRNANDLNGLGAFLIMNEALAAPTLGYTPKRIDWTLK